MIPTPSGLIIDPASEQEYGWRIQDAVLWLHSYLGPSGELFWFAVVTKFENHLEDGVPIPNDSINGRSHFGGSKSYFQGVYFRTSC
jgi:hypothetical protein